MPQDVSAALRAFHTGLHELRRHWGWYLALGILLIILGIIALGNALLATLASIIALGRWPLDAASPSPAVTLQPIISLGGITRGPGSCSAQS
jgi:hypothetical protein